MTTTTPALSLPTFSARHWLVNSLCALGLALPEKSLVLNPPPITAHHTLKGEGKHRAGIILTFFFFLLDEKVQFLTDIRLLERVQQNGRKYGLWKKGGCIEFLRTVRGQAYSNVK